MAEKISSKEQIKSSLKAEAFPLSSYSQVTDSFICGPYDSVCTIGDLKITPAGAAEKLKSEIFSFEDAEKFSEYLMNIYGIPE
jgi:hypothetical protein